LPLLPAALSTCLHSVLVSLPEYFKISDYSD